MKLLHRDLSPHSAQVRAQIYAKGLAVPLVSTVEAESIDGLGANSLPRLVLEERVVLTDSWAIMEYLEALYPLPRLMPETALGQAQVRAKASIANRVLLPLLLPMFLTIKYAQYTDADMIRSGERLRSIYRHFDDILTEFQTPVSLVGEQLDLADCALAPMLFFAQALPRLYGQPDVIGDYRRVAQWWESVRLHTAIERVLYELQRGFQTYIAS